MYGSRTEKGFYTTVLLGKWSTWSSREERVLNEDFAKNAFYMTISRRTRFKWELREERVLHDDLAKNGMRDRTLVDLY